MQSRLDDRPIHCLTLTVTKDSRNTRFAEQVFHRMREHANLFGSDMLQIFRFLVTRAYGFKFLKSSPLRPWEFNKRKHDILEFFCQATMCRGKYEASLAKMHYSYMRVNTVAVHVGISR